MLTSSTLLLVLSLLVTADAALFNRNSPVKQLTGTNGLKSTLSNGYPAVVAFTAPWCGHCQRLTPEFEKAADSLKPLIGFYNVDCDEDVNKQLCAKEDIKGFPTIKSYPKGSLGQPRDYQGARDAKAFVDHASNLIPLDKCKKMKSQSDLEDWKAKSPATPHILLLHPSSPSIPLLWRTLSSRLSSALSFGFLRDEGGVISKGLGLNDGKDGVRVVWWDEQGELQKYDAGALKYEPLYAHFSALAKRIDPSFVETGSPSKSASSRSTSTAPMGDSVPTDHGPPIVTPNAADRRAKERAEMEAKWQEEERRDKARREKRESERLEKLLADQERLTPDEMDEEEVEDAKRRLQEGLEGIVGDGIAGNGQSAATPLEEALEADHGVTDVKTGADVLDTDLGSDEGVEAIGRDGKRDEGSSTADASPDGTSESPIGDEGQSASTPLEEAAEDFDHGTTGAKGSDEGVRALDSDGNLDEGVTPQDASPEGTSESSIGDEGKSARTPLEEEAEDFEHGTSGTRLHEEL